jgi:hypothetical protein
MSKERSRSLLVAFLLLFVAVTLNIDFFHTEAKNRGANRDNCPACHFLNSALSISPDISFTLIVLVCQGMLAPADHRRLAEVSVLSVPSRSPPQA